MKKELMTNVISDLYSAVKTQNDVREIRAILNNIEKTLKPQDKGIKFSVGDKVISKLDRTIKNGVVVSEEKDGKIKVKDGKYTWIVPVASIIKKEK